MSNAGRKPVSKEYADELFRKLEPFLKAGLSVNKACLEAGVPKSTVYDLLQTNNEFSEKIMRSKQFVSVLIANTMMAQLHEIIKKQNPGNDANGNPLPKVPLDKEDLKFLTWFATHSNQTREEFTERKDVNLHDPESEIKRLAKLMDDMAGDKNGKDK